MNLHALWAELESAPAPGEAVARRRLPTTSTVDLNITLSQPGPVRGLALTVADIALVNVADLPSTRGLDHRRYAAASAARTTLEIRLTDPAANELFVALATDVARATAAAGDDQDAVGLWLSRIKRWQRLMAQAPQGLGRERQLGLFAELEVLSTDLLKHLDVAVAVEGWQGPLGGHDFQLPGGALEVKGSAAHEPQVAMVNSERQLDTTGTDSLHLVHVSLDVHQHAGRTLPDLVARIRDIAAGTDAEDALEDRLLDAGYADAHAHQYRTTGYTVRQKSFFEIGDGFPRIVESDLLDGVGGVTYKLVIAACAPFEVDRSSVLSRFGGAR
jgi:hypothetical protein